MVWYYFNFNTTTCWVCIKTFINHWSKWIFEFLYSFFVLSKWSIPILSKTFSYFCSSIHIGIFFLIKWFLIFNVIIFPPLSQNSYIFPMKPRIFNISVDFSPLSILSSENTREKWCFTTNISYFRFFKFFILFTISTIDFLHSDLFKIYSKNNFLII